MERESAKRPLKTMKTLSRLKAAWQSEWVAHGDGARTRRCDRISVSHYVPEKMACKLFLWVKEKHIKKKQYKHTNAEEEITTGALPFSCSAA